MAALVFETVEVRPDPGGHLASPPEPVRDAPALAAFGASPRGASPHSVSTSTPCLTLAWHVHQSVRPLQPRVLDRVPPADGGLVCATVVRAGPPAEPAGAVGLAPWVQQWWLGPAVGTPRTIYLQTSAV
jgi:hypothetical protein